MERYIGEGPGAGRRRPGKAHGFQRAKRRPVARDRAARWSKARLGGVNSRNIVAKIKRIGKCLISKQRERGQLCGLRLSFRAQRGICSSRASENQTDSCPRAKTGARPRNDNPYVSE